MKKRFISMFVALVLMVTAAQPALAAESSPADNMLTSTTARVISREEYISAVAELEGLPYEVVEKRDNENVGRVTRASDERIAYAMIEKPAGNKIIGVNLAGGDYTRTVIIAAYVKYLYNYVSGKPIEILEISAPYAFIDTGSFSIDNITFSHGDYSVKLQSTTKGSVTVIGDFTYEEEGFSIGVGGNLVSVSKTVGGYKIKTERITFIAYFLLSDCPHR